MSVGACHQLARTGASSRVDPIMTSSGRGPCSRSAGSLSRLTLCLRPCRSPAVFVIFRSPFRAVEDLYHSALEVRDRGSSFVIEMGPAWDNDAAERGVVLEGPVGARWLGRYRPFRYEVRCWRGGRIPDVAEAVGGPQRLSNDKSQVAHLLEIVLSVPP